MKHSNEFINIITNGLTLDNLRKLIPLCKREISETDNPLLPFTLLTIFEGLTEWWNYDMTLNKDYLKINNLLSNDLINVIGLSMNNDYENLLINLEKIVSIYWDLQNDGSSPQ